MGLAGESGRAVYRNIGAMGERVRKRVPSRDDNTKEIKKCEESAQAFDCERGKVNCSQALRSIEPIIVMFRNCLSSNSNNPAVLVVILPCGRIIII